MDPDLFSTPYLWLWKGCGKYLCSSLFHQVIHIVHKPPVVYSSVLRPLQPKASLWTGSTPWSWARWACCRLPHSPLWAPHRVSTAESDSPRAACFHQSQLWELVVLERLTSALLKPPKFSRYGIFSFDKLWKMNLRRFQIVRNVEDHEKA